MKKYLLRFSVAFLTFACGTLLVSNWFVDSLSYQTPKINEVNIDYVQSLKIGKNQLLRFEHSLIADGWDEFGNTATSNGYIASDGTRLSDTGISLRSEKAALKRFQREIKNAKVIELSPYLDYWNRKIGEKAFLQKNEETLLIIHYNHSSTINIISAPSLHHVKTFEAERESSQRSGYLNRL